MDNLKSARQSIEKEPYPGRLKLQQPFQLPSNSTLQLKAATVNLDASQASTINLTNATEMIGTIRRTTAKLRSRMALKYATENQIDHFNVGDLVSLRILSIDRASTDHWRLLCRVVYKPHPDRHQLWCVYGLLNRHYPNWELEKVPSTNELPDAWALRQAELHERWKTVNFSTLRQAARMAATFPTPKWKCNGPCSTRSCPCQKRNKDCTFHSHNEKQVKCSNQDLHTIDEGNRGSHGNSEAREQDEASEQDEPMSEQNEVRWAGRGGWNGGCCICT